VLTLFGIVLATGIVVDDAIVVIENIERHMREFRKSARQAAVDAMREVFSAVVVIGIVLVAVFVPVAFFPGVTGRLYQQFSLTIAFSVVLSVFNAVTLTPALAALLLDKESHTHGRFFTGFNRVVDAGTNGYVKVVRGALRWRIVMILLFAGGLFATYTVYRAVPSSFVPQEDEGFLMCIVQAPAGASLEYTTDIAKKAEQILFADKDVAAAFSVMGFSFSGAAPNNGMIFVRLKDYAERPNADQSLSAVLQRVSGPLFMIPGAIVVAFPPPSIQGIGVFGGFQFEVLDQTGSSDINQLAAATFGLMGAANQSGKIQGAFSSFRADDPQMIVDIDRDQARSLGLPLREVTEALQVFLGSQYVNDFDFNNRAYRVFVQADQRFRASPANLKQLYARASNGDMIPLDSVVTLRETTAPQVISHFNLFRSAEITGNPAPGQSSGQTLQAMEELARANLPPGFDFAWAGQSLEEQRAGGQAGVIFGLSLLLVYLVLAAQYESFILPFIILLGVPLAVFGALSAQLLRGFNNDIFCQVGLVLLVGLAAKNSILIVEFAEQLRERGLSIIDAAIESARIRLRPILMTSFAFILGVLPLALATGAGAASRNSVGTAVAGGMIASTFLSIFFIPVLYVVIRSIFPGRAHRDRGEDVQDTDVRRAGALAPAGPTAIGIILVLAIAAPVFAQPSDSADAGMATAKAVALRTQEPPIETVTFDEAIARALEKNPTVAIAATNILRSEALLQQARAGTQPRVSASITNTTLDSGRSFGDQTVQPRNQSLFGLSASMPFAATQWAARVQAMDQVEIARLSVTETRRLIAVAAASAYLAVIAQKRQVEVSLTAIETARGQLDFNTRRREGGVGSRLNELRSAQVLAATEALLEVLRLNVLRAQEALGVLLAADGPVDVDGEPSFEVPRQAPESEWLPHRPDVRVFTAQRDANERIVTDSRKDWWPAASVNFGPQLLTPSGLFQPSRTWSLTLQLSQPLFDGAQRRGLRRQREAVFQASTLSLEQLQIDARSEVRHARAAVAARERALASARQSVGHANEVLKITIIAFEAGATTNIEVIDAQRSARDQESLVAQAEDALRQARLDLLVALGQFPK
jgi:outer membrane protein TolC/preprotein translocase subunit SecF